MPLPEGRGPPCSGPDCYTKNGPRHPGCTPDARAAQRSSVAREQTEHTKGSPGAQWRRRLREFTAWVLLLTSMVVNINKLVDGVQVLIDLISQFLAGLTSLVPLMDRGDHVPDPVQRVPVLIHTRSY